MLAWLLWLALAPQTPAPQASDAGEALAKLRRAVALDPRSAQAHLQLAQGYLATRRIEFIAEAKAELRQALDLDPQLVWARFYLAKIYIDLGQLDTGQSQLEQALATRPRTPHFLALLGEVRRKRSDPEASIRLNQSALEADPSMNAAHYHIALAQIDLGAMDKAEQSLRRALDSPFLIPEMYLALGSIQLARSEPAQAEQTFLQALRLDPARPETFLKLGEAARKSGRHAQALDYLGRAFPPRANYPNSAYYQELRAGVACETGRVHLDQGDRKRAAQSFEQALAIDPGHAASRAELSKTTPSPHR